MDHTERNRRIKQMIKDYTAKHTQTPEAAREALIREGIFDADGSLAPEYGGRRAGDAPTSDRIQELAKQAMVPSAHEGLGGPYMSFDREKFAELIVRECASLFEDDGRVQIGTLALCKDLARETILKHFGIKP